MPLEELRLSNTSVRDITALKGMPLRRLNLARCANIRDLTPLAECEELRDLVLPPNVGEIYPASSGIEFLRRLPNLERISYKSTKRGASWTPSQTAEEFWAEYDAREKTVTGLPGIAPSEDEEAKPGDQLPVIGEEEEGAEAESDQPATP